MTATYPPAVSAGGTARRADEVPGPARYPGKRWPGWMTRPCGAIVGSAEVASWGGTAARELLVARHRRLVFSCVQRYRGSPEPAEDLVQVGYLGLMSAITRYDPAAGRDLAAYAQVCISGEIKRHFREKCWPVHVRRLGGGSGSAGTRGHHHADPGPAPTAHARRDGPPNSRQRGRPAGRTAGGTRLPRHPHTTPPGSIAAGPGTLGHAPRPRSPRGGTHDRHPPAVAAHWGELAPREQMILRMRFRDDITQVRDRPAARHPPDERDPAERSRPRPPPPAPVRLAARRAASPEAAAR